MKNKFIKNYLIYSTIFHLLIILTALFCTHSNKKINKQFLVFGAHSKVPTMALFKSNKNLNQTDWYARRLTQENKRKREAKIRQETKMRNAKIKAKKLLQSKKQKVMPENKSVNKNNTAFKEDIEKIKVNSKKINPKKINITKKEEAQKEPVPEEAALEKEANHEKIDGKVETTDNITDQDIPEEEMQINLLGENDQEIIKYQESIQKEVSRLWHPPIGVPKGTQCLVKFYIEKNGSVEKYEILQKSNILIYDLSVIQVALKFKFEESLWGKNFSIYFRQ